MVRRLNESLPHSEPVVFVDEPCGLASPSEERAVRILELCVEIGERVREQAVATRLSVGA